MKIELRSTLLVISLAMVAVFFSACQSTPTATGMGVAVLNDGELPLPSDYKTWPKFLTAVQRPDAKQVRDIYMNPIAKNGGSAAKGFPNGSVFVMENYSAAENADGSLKKDADGKLVKGALVAVFVQGKNPGWGDKAVAVLKNGDWIYSAYTPAGAKGPQDTNSCRACHLPLVKQDFVHRYDEFFGVKSGAVKPINHAHVVASLSIPKAISEDEATRMGAMVR